MKLIVITKEDNIETREALEIADKIVSEGYEVQKIDWESDEATTLAKLYDIYSTPAFIVSGDDGRLVEKWQGSQMPLACDITYLM